VKILLVVDGSSYSETVTRTLIALRLPSRTEVTVLMVVPEHTFLGGITLGKITGTLVKKEAQQQKAMELIQGPVQAISSSSIKVKSLVQWGNITETILNVARENDLSLIVMGAKGLTDSPQFPLGNVAQKVMKYANASVLLVRDKAATMTEAPLRRDKTTAINRVLLATNGSKYADAVILFLLNLPLPRNTEVIVITALQSHLEALIKTPTLDLRTNQELLANLQAAEEHEARKITTRVERQFQTKGYKTASILMRGGAAECILVAAKEYKPDIIALGSRGLSGIKSFLLGNVAERVARYAKCSVLIGRSSK
jgi:nucleotide-binding universal stress UspA family protein